MRARASVRQDQRPGRGELGPACSDNAPSPRWSSPAGDLRDPVLPHGLFALLTAAAFLVALWEWTRLLGFARTTLRLGLVGVQAPLLAALWFAREAPVVDRHRRRRGLVALGRVVAGIFPSPPRRRGKTAGSARRRLPGGAAGLGGLMKWNCTAATRGPAWTLFGLILVWVADSGAYLAGSRWGGHEETGTAHQPGQDTGRYCTGPLPPARWRP